MRRSYLLATSPCPIRRPDASVSSVEHDAVKHLVHGARGLRATSFTDHLGRHASDCDIVRYRLDDNRAGGDACAMANLDIGEDLGAGTDHHATADFRMAVLVLLASA